MDLSPAYPAAGGLGAFAFTYFLTWATWSVLGLRWRGGIGRRRRFRAVDPTFALDTSGPRPPAHRFHGARSRIFTSGPDDVLTDSMN